MTRFQFGFGFFKKKSVWLVFIDKNRTEPKIITPTSFFSSPVPGVFFPFFFVSRCFFSFQLVCCRDSWVGFDWFSFKEWGLLDCSREGGPAYWFPQWILRFVRGRFSWWLIAVECIWWLRAVGFGDWESLWCLNWAFSGSAWLRVCGFRVDERQLRGRLLLEVARPCVVGVTDGLRFGSLIEGKGWWVLWLLMMFFESLTNGG